MEGGRGGGRSGFHHSVICLSLVDGVFPWKLSSRGAVGEYSGPVWSCLQRWDELDDFFWGGVDLLLLITAYLGGLAG